MNNYIFFNDNRYSLNWLIISFTRWRTWKVPSLMRFLIRNYCMLWVTGVVYFLLPYPTYRRNYIRYCPLSEWLPVGPWKTIICNVNVLTGERLLFLTINTKLVFVNVSMVRWQFYLKVLMILPNHNYIYAYVFYIFS